MFRRAGRIGLILSLACTYLLQISPPVASAVSTDCSISGGQYCKATFSYSGARESWVIPAGITNITVDVVGAAGGDGTSLGGKGSRMQGSLTTTPGNTLYLYVGQRGLRGALSNDTSRVSPASYLGGGGGGGSFLLTQTNSSPLIVAGGGGGGMGPCCTMGAAWYASYPGLDASLTTSGTNADAISGAAGAGGTGGNGGAGGGGSGGGGGGGLLTDGGTGTSAGQYGRSLVNGLTGGSAVATCNSTWGTGGAGGFGGGGAACGGAGGGGGGYSGGGGSGGSSNWGPGGGGGSYLDASVTSTTSTSAFGTGDGYITITYLNAPTPTVFTTSQSNPTNTSSSISYSITFSQNVNSVANSDFSNAGTATGCSFSINSASGTSFTLTISSCSEGTLIPQVIANSVFGTTTSTNGPGSNALTTTPITIDRTAPTISSVTAPGNQTYIPGNAITFSLNMAETVTVSGTPRLSLTIGSTTRYANYASGSNSKTLLFTYTVQSSTSDVDVDGIALNTPLDLNSGTITDLATNALSVLAVSTSSLTSVLVAQPAAAPTIDSVVAASGQLAIYFSAGAARGSTTSTYQYTSNGGAWTNRPTGTTASPIILTGLTNGTGYTIRIRATTNAGPGDSSTAITETPTSISVSGDSTLTLTFGNSASTSAYSATGGTGTYTWSLGSSLTGVTLSGTTVTASSSTPAGTYSQTVRATDGNSQVGSKTLTITVSKASTSITISLPNASSTAALGGAVTITATVPRAGAVNFMLGGSTISGCGSATAASTSATCSWTPGVLGSVSLTATFTPTDASNYETSTTTTLSITVVNGVSSVTLALTGGVTQTQKGNPINIIATIDQAGKISFYIDGKRIPGCYNLSTSAGTKSCSWKPAVQTKVNLTATLNPTSSVYNNSTGSLAVWVVRRTGNR
jgi:hypothetical protein